MQTFVASTASESPEKLREASVEDPAPLTGRRDPQRLQGLDGRWHTVRGPRLQQHVNRRVRPHHTMSCTSVHGGQHRGQFNTACKPFHFHLNFMGSRRVGPRGRVTSGEGWAPKGGKGWGPGCGLKGGRPKISRVCPSPAPFSLFFVSLSGGLLVNFWWCLKCARGLKCARLEFSGCRVKPWRTTFWQHRSRPTPLWDTGLSRRLSGVGLKWRQGLHDSPRAQTCTFEGPGASKTPPKFRDKTPRERERERERERKKERKRNFGWSGEGLSRRRAVPWKGGPVEAVARKGGPAEGRSGESAVLRREVRTTLTCTATHKPNHTHTITHTHTNF